MAKAELLHSTPLWVALQAIRTCWDSFERSDSGGPVDRNLMLRVGNKLKHSSTLEHITYNFFISDFSRATLQELARHRIASPSVKSTRYTLKELKEEKPFEIITLNEINYEKDYRFNNQSDLLGIGCSDINHHRATKYLVMTGDADVDMASIAALENLRKLVQAGKPNDRSKFALPDSYKTQATWSINMRSMQNFIKLRTDKAAMWEIRELARAIYEAIPEDHKFLVEEFVYQAPVDE